jgi:hypothetical protein
MMIILRRRARQAHETLRDVFVLAVGCAAVGMVAMVALWLIAAPILLIHHFCRPA